MTTVRQAAPDPSLDGALVLDLARLDARLLPSVGGKAANLGELIGAGFAVPTGFCVTTSAYQQVAAGSRIEEALEGRTALDAPVGEVGGPAERARAAILAAPVPAAVAAAVVGAYRALGDDVPVAVRSSATAEDLPSASFAGQQDTYLNIVGAEAVLDAVRRCWASLWTDRALTYRTTNGIDHRSVQLAVIVQHMVDAEVAGVLFTADPVTGHRGHAVIDANPGLGEAVVSGAVNPDHFVVDADGTVVERRPGDKRVVISSRPGGGTERRTRTADDGQSCLSDAQLRELAALGRQVQSHYGTPQDIEWALDASGAWWLTQARPITTLYPLPVADRDQAAPARVYFCASLAQGLTRPITPMGIASFRLIASCVSEVVFGSVVPDPRRGPALFAEAGQRVFVDCTSVLHSRVGRALVPRILDVMEARSAVVLRALSGDPRFAVQTTSRWPFVRRLIAVAVRFRIPLQVAQALVRPAAARRRVDRVGRRLRATLTIPATATGAQRVDHAERLLATSVVPIMPTVTPVAGTGFLAQALAGKLGRDELEHREMDEVLRALPHNVTTEMDLELWALAGRIRADAVAADTLRGAAPAELARRFTDRQLPAPLQCGLDEFLARHGHRAVAEIDVGMPRWSDDPTYVLGVLANYLRLENPELAPDAQFARGSRAAEATVAEVVGRIRRRSRLRAAAMRLALGRVRELVGMRETHKDYLVRVLAHVRQQLAVVGAEIAAAGGLDEPADVFFLDLTETRAALAGTDFRAVVAQRRTEYDRELRRRQVPRIMLSDGTVPENVRPDPSAVTGAQATEDRLTGTPASAGTVTGVARVVLDPVGAHLEPGEILVTPSTDPGWTPLFLTAGGLVMEMGGANSHGAVVAREYGIPAVVGVRDATMHITNGQQITVRGATGLVELG
ncbi:MAG: PEP/pyruvate-binding domain-containing protein [Pseudonocardiaceae bacterium]